LRFFYFYIFGKHFLQKYIFNITIYSFVPLPPLHWAAGGLPPGRGAAGSLMLYKRFPSPLLLHLLPTTSREREGERRGEGGSCNGEALPDFGS